MSPILVLALTLVPTFLAVGLFVAVVIGIHLEPRYGMATKARNPLSALARRVLGIHVIRPDDSHSDDHREECLTGQSTDWWNTGGGDQ